MRNISFRIFLLTISILVISAASARTAAGADTVRVTLKNGLRVVIVRNRLDPVVATVVNYMVGSDEAPRGSPGMAHAQEHMMFRGNPGLTTGQIAGLIATMGGRSHS